MLTDRDREILQFEERHRAHTGEKERAISSELSLTVPRYYQLLNSIIDQPAALAEFPLLVKGLHRMRSARLARRHSRSLGEGIGYTFGYTFGYTS